MSASTSKFSPYRVLLIALLICSGCGMTGYGRTRDDASQKPIYHRVTAGENLSGISKKYGISSDRLAYLNGIHSEKGLNTGRRLLVGYGTPGNSKQTGAALVRASYRGEQPDTLDRIPYSGGRLAWPMRQGRIVSGFGPRSGSFHDGLDISAPLGTPVYAAHDGTVVYSDDGLSGYGNLVIVRGRDGLTTVYAHNRRLLVDVGDGVKRNEKIAEVGSTGRSSGPHLHFEVRMKDVRGRFVALDPLPLLNKIRDPKPRFRQNERLTPIINRRS